MSQDESLKKQLREMMQKADRSMAAAKRHMEGGDYDFASSRAYYASFYTMEAILLTRNLAFSKHSGVISAFNQHFIKPGIFPTEFSRLIARLSRDRQIGDYGFGVSIAEGEATQDILSAERIVEAIKNYLIQEGFIEAGN